MLRWCVRLDPTEVGGEGWLMGEPFSSWARDLWCELWADMLLPAQRLLGGFAGRGHCCGGHLHAPLRHWPCTAEAQQACTDPHWERAQINSTSV